MIDTLRLLNNNELVLIEYTRGSRAYGLATEDSDMDTGGVFMANTQSLLTPSFSGYKDEVSDEKKDMVLWELNKFANLLNSSNPTALEALFMPMKYIRFMEPVFNIFREQREKFLTKACFKPFGHYAADQIRKARSTNKMIVQPILERLTPADFCYAIHGNDTVPVRKFLEINKLQEDEVSLAKLNHFRDGYAIFQHPGGFCRSGANDVHISDIPKGKDAIGFMIFNKDAYTCHCRDYKKQKRWEQERNPKRYGLDLEKGYNAKNISHCIRLVRMCTEIANGEGYIIDRMGRDAEFLIQVKQGKYEYDDLMEIANQDIEVMEYACEHSSLPDAIYPGLTDELALRVRKSLAY